MTSGAEPLRRVPWSARESRRPWPSATHALLLGTGAVLALGILVTVLNMPDLPYHPARDLELRATYDAYLETGVPLVKQNGTGTWYGGAVPGAGLTKAAGDDDPGSYLIASWMSHLTGSASPYPGLRWVMALLCALPMLILPVTVARVFGRARAGVAMLALPALTWLVNGTVLTGTEYGLADQVSPTRVYALYGLPASLMFLSLVLVAYAVVRRPGVRAALAWTAVLVVLAVCGNLLRSLSGVGIALAVGVVWWVAWRGRLRWAVAVGAALLGAGLSWWLPGVVMDRINESRDRVVIAEASRLPDAHGTWHPLYLGLSYPQPITGAPSPFGVQWSDEFGWQKAREIDPDVVIASAEYDAIMKDLFLDEVKGDPLAAVRLYLTKAFFVVKHFAAVLVVVLFAVVMVWRRRGSPRRRMLQASAAAVPILLLGLIPTVLVMPMLYYFSELAAGLGLLLALALGGLVWTISTMPSVVRVDERTMARDRLVRAEPGPHARLSVVVPTRNGEDVLTDCLETLATRLTDEDELVVVENGSTDGTTALLESVAAAWSHAVPLRVLHSEPGLGHALRTGVLASRGRRVLLTADDLPFGFTDLDAFDALPSDAVVAVGSKAHPASRVDRVWRRELQSRVFRWLRSALLHSTVGDSQGTIWVDGPWARSFAAVSREGGLMWTVELVLAAEQQGIDVWEVPVTLEQSHDAVASRFRLRDARIAVVEIVSLAVRKDDYSGQQWMSAGQVLADVGQGAS
ncbi:glycosyltransferase [Nocardioides baculatus]|uniref:Glycosyltransferase n=1 Tax=Nocardioides baculatus TaxID=2801337 RepID=A0ABS1L6M2_9ACTN|nr:glycosyltransferase [Nocardioides baculatus]MBL0747203.1 glycosyltransferase [Nocardioides baculatus]